MHSTLQFEPDPALVVAAMDEIQERKSNEKLSIRSSNVVIISVYTVANNTPSI